MRVGVIGAGYVGLVQAAGLAHLGHTVRLSDASRDRIEMLRRGEVPIFEHGLPDLVSRGVDHGQLTFHDENLEAVEDAEVVFLTLPTPQAGDGRADMSFIQTVVDEIAPKLAPGAVVATKSTVPVGTADRLRARLEELGATASVVSNPEFLREGSAVDDFMKAERIVVGAFDLESGQRVADLYRGLPSEVIITDPRSAELIKYAANAYLATRLTFVNSMANLAQAVGADVSQVLGAVGLDRRIGPHFLSPGPGYGGSCLPKDVSALAAIAEDHGFEFKLLKTVQEVDGEHRQRIVERLDGLLGGLAGKTLALWGVAFKAGTDDTRDSPALKLAAAIRSRGGRVVAWDPEASSEEVEMAAGPIKATRGADALLVATEWPEFMRVDLERVAQLMRGRVVFDARNLLDPERVREAGLDYHSLGRR